MISLVERIISYILGGVVGYGLGTFLSTPSMHIMDSESGAMIVSIMPIIGVLIAMIVVEFRYEHTLKKNNAIRDETVALITHEMRTSLTSSGWAIDMMLKKYETTITAEDAKLLSGVVNSIHTTVMHSVNLLDVSLLDIGKLSISLEWTKLSTVQEMVQEIVEKYTLGAAHHGITLVAEVSLSAEKMVEVDMLRLRIVLENLLENAIQYTVEDQSGTTKKIGLHISNTEKEMAISVNDTGIGIPESEKEKIFSEFYRASNARRKLSNGSGIGLYTCAKYVNAHRGTITFKSEENVGTTFFITIPLKTEADVKGFLEKI